TGSSTWKTWRKTRCASCTSATAPSWSGRKGTMLPPSHYRSSRRCSRARKKVVDRPRRKEVEKVRASVVVPTCRRPELLGRCLDAMAAQDFDPSHYEVVVADD